MPRLFNLQRMVNTVFIGDEWKTRDDVIQSFAPSFGYHPNPVQSMDDYYLRWKDIELLFCAYTYEGTKADAFILFKDSAADLYEVNAAHCSCYGLEGQFEPEQTTITALKYRIENGKLGRDFFRKNIFAEELTAFLNLIA
jgi:hypothetical protein